jgi:hypothetical protein
MEAITDTEKAQRRRKLRAADVVAMIAIAILILFILLI